MTEEQFNVELQRLMTIVKGAEMSDEAKEKLEKLADQTKQRNKDLKDSITKIEDSIGTLRLCIKYLLFDLEATKRENLYLKKMLNDNGNPEEPSV